MLGQIDHFVWGAPDLDAGCAQIESLFGVAPEPGGVHSGLGTCNALLSLGTGLYLEIMAPHDPAPDSVGDRLARLDAPGLVTWVLASTNLPSIADLATSRTIAATPLGPVKTERMTPQGERLSWELLFLTHHAYAGLVPFFIDWQGSPHPSTTAPLGGQATELVVSSPKAAGLNQVFADLEVEHIARPSPDAALGVHFTANAGDVVLRSTAQSLRVLEM